ncbi:MAG: S-layer homology domain-containing protein [Clostridia bacterium]|nr:S-layer homology domain-containing protein [Clostridia bacterium]
MKFSDKFMAVTLISSMLAMPAYAEGIFADMTNYKWAEESVEYLYNKGIVKGTSKVRYSPSAEMRRGDFALILQRYYNLTPVSDNYADISADMYYADAISSIKGVEAYIGENFEPERAITREEAVGLIYSVIYNTTGITEEQFCEDAAQYYSDANEIKWDKINAVATLTNMGIIQGDEGKFMPKKTMNRAELAVVMHNLDKINNADTTPLPEETPGTDIPEDVPQKPSAPEIIEVDALNVITTDTSEASRQYTASGNDQSVRAVYDAHYTASGVTLSKSAGVSTNSEKSRTLGLNSALYGANAKVDLSNVSIMATAPDADGIFLAGNSTSEIINSALVATGENSSAIGVKDNSSVSLVNTRFSSAGKNAPVMKVFEGGKLVANGGFVVSEGANSPGIYSLGSVEINNTNVSISGDSYAVQVSGNGNVTGNAAAFGGKGIMLFNENEFSRNTATFTANNSNITTTSDCVFYVTNADSVINLTGNTITVPRNAVLLRALSGEYGTPDANGGHVTLNVKSQTLNGDIITDSLSSVTLNLLGGVVYRGTLNPINYTGAMNISLSADSHWSLNADSYVTVFENADTTCSNIISNGFNIIYDPSAEGNKWLEGKTIELGGGGMIKPAY